MSRWSDKRRERQRRATIARRERRRRAEARQLRGTEQLVIERLRARGPLTTDELAVATALTPATVGHALVNLTRLRLVIDRGAGLWEAR
jgi:DNA-binding transcriptional ArsR family regulator